MVFRIFLFLCKLGNISELFGVNFIWFLLNFDDNILMVLLFKFSFLLVLKLLLVCLLLGLIKCDNMGLIMVNISVIIIRLFIIYFIRGIKNGCF